MGAPSTPPTDPAVVPATPLPRRPAGVGGSSMVWVVVAVVLVVVVAGSVGVYYAYFRSPSPTSPSNTAGAFANGQVVTFVYNGSNTYLCTPSVTTMFPKDPNSTGAAAVTSCEAGNASQTAVVGQLPQWYLVPAFAGLSDFGLTALNATPRGFATTNGSTIETDCGAGGTPTACPDHPQYLFSPLVAQAEADSGLGHGAQGLPVGVMPFPAHDMLENYTTYPLVSWGTIFVFVFDPNILPDRTTGACVATAPSNLTSATGNCLTTWAHVYAAADTCSSAAQHYNSAVGNPLWKAFMSSDHLSPCAQAYVPAPGTFGPAGPASLLNSNVYVPYAVQPGAPSSFPT